MARRKKRKRKDSSQASAERPAARSRVSAAREPLIHPIPDAPTDSDARRLTAALVELEIARGHDGLLRGKPEPVLLVGAYLAGAGPVRLLGRSLLRLTPTLPFPSAVKVRPEDARLFEKYFRSKPAARIVVLGLAFEEDAGTDVTRVYADLEHPARLRIWPFDAAMPAPHALDEVAQDPMWDRHAARVHLLMHDADIRDACTEDKFIGACILTVSNTDRYSDCWRLHFLAENGRNDWTATLQMVLE